MNIIVTCMYLCVRVAKGGSSGWGFIPPPLNFLEVNIIKHVKKIPKLIEKSD